MGARNNFGSGRDDEMRNDDNRSSRDDAGRYDAMGNYTGTSRNFSSGREHGYRDPVNEGQDQYRRESERSSGQSRYGSGDYRSSPYENEQRGYTNEQRNYGGGSYGTQYATPGSSGSTGTGSWGGGSYGSSEYGTNFRDSQSLQGGSQRFGEQYGQRYPLNEDRYRGDRSDAWMGRSEQDGSYRTAGNYRNSGDMERSWERQSMGRNRGSDYESRPSSNWGSSQYGSSMSPSYGRNHMSGFGSEHRDSSFNRYGTEPSRYNPDQGRYDQSSWESRDGESTWDDIRHRGQRMMNKVGEFFGVGPKGYTRSDSRIQEDVNDALMDDPDVDATHIEVKVENGEVTLEGFVSDRPMKRHAEDVCAHCRGVREVHNHLRTRPLSSSTVGDVHATSGLPQASTSMTSGLKTEATAEKKTDRNHKTIS